jgi:hypothetical protein
MEALLLRTYAPGGVNGRLFFYGEEICRTLELPWKENKPGISCIPEGSYALRRRFSPRFKNHFEILGVPGRKYILFHAGNNALKELRGCIAPVLQHTGEGRGLHSRMALQKMKDRLYPVLDKGIELTLTIKEAKS